MRWLGELGALAGIGAYVLAVGGQPSVVRAGIAGALASLAWMVGRLRDAWYALLLGAIALLAWNPYLVFDAGFQLSFAAVAAIFTLVPPLTLARGLSVAAVRARRRGRLDRVRRRDGADPLVQFGPFPSSRPANALVEPAIPLLLGLAFVTAGLGAISPVAAALVAWLNGWIAAYVASGRARSARFRSPRSPRTAASPRSGASFSPPPMLGADGRGAEARVPHRRERPSEGRPRRPAAEDRFTADAVELHRRPR